MHTVNSVGALVSLTFTELRNGNASPRVRVSSP